MYKVIGADGKAYGPISLDQLQQWAVQGRVNPQSQLLAEGASEWQAAADIPEVQAVFETAGFGAAPALAQGPMGAAAGGAVKKGLAITSLVLGILSLVILCLSPLFGIPAIICGHVAQGRTRRRPSEFGGGGIAIAGFVLGYVSLALNVFILPAMLLPALARAKERAQMAWCRNNLVEIGMAFRTWSLDHTNQLPFNLSTNAGGTLELCNRDAKGYDRNAFLHFMVLSNEVSTPKVLVCPASGHGGSGNPSPAPDFQHLTAANVSYLLCTGPSINESNPSATLAICPVCGSTLLVDGSVQVSPSKWPPRGVSRPSE